MNVNILMIDTICLHYTISSKCFFIGLFINLYFLGKINLLKTQ